MLVGVGAHETVTSTGPMLTNTCGCLWNNHRHWANAYKYWWVFMKKSPALCQCLHVLVGAQEICTGTVSILTDTGGC